ncbi:phage major capsid protein [Proteiniphilum acetatigenes]|uniref:phage major capsid protein n=1 Tax=Proteiniphilum acetatigenes TaxID=294710 RepID=UPI000376B349|nr:phage major capsid protein [Proteiniphilum acetatigenes]
MEQSLLQVIDQRNQVQEKLNNLINSAEKEQRKLTEKEDTDFKTLTDELRNLNDTINQLNKETKQTIMEKFSLIKTINNVVNKRNQDEAVEEVINLGKEELRKAGQPVNGDVVIPMELRADITAASGAGIEKNTVDLVTALKSNLVLVNAGATYMGGLAGNVGIPTYSGTNVAWAGETASAADGAGSLAEVILKPKRLTAYVDVSKQFLIQESADAEAVLRDDIAKAIAVKLESTILGSVAGSDTQPAGMFVGVTPETDPADEELVNGLDEALDEKNVQNKKYILSPKAKSAFKGIEMITGRAAYQDNEVDGYPAFVTTAAVSKGVIAGDFSDLVIAQ